jgi:aminoglycoside 2''-phosphotransferase
VNKHYTVEDCKRRIQHAFPQIDLHTLTPVHTGWDSFVLDVNGEYIFRFPLREDVATSLGKEIVLLPELAQVLSVQVPRFEWVSSMPAEGEFCFVGYPKIGGVALNREISASPLIARQLGRILTELHAFSVKRAIRLGVRGGDIASWRCQYEEFYTWARQHALPLLGEPVRSKAICLWEWFLDEVQAFRFPLVLIHGDLAEEHILCDDRRREVVGIIDWGDAVIGDPAMDFVGLYGSGGRDLVERVLGTYQGDPGTGFWERVLFYEAISPFHEIQYGLDTDDNDHLHRGIDAVCYNIEAWSYP